MGVTEKKRDEIYYKAALRIIRVSEYIKGKRRRELSKLNVSLVRGAIIRHIVRLGKKATLSELSRRVIKEPHGISMLVSRMEKEGLVRRIRDLHRKNLVRVELTKKGRELHELVAIDTVTVPVISCLTVEEVKELVIILDKIIEYEKQYPVLSPH
ncbi:MarR family winged helix-turn-helix transcriptional regulator [Chloroflexota bacterium]